MFNKTANRALVLSAAVALTASTGMVAVAQDDEMAEGGLICVIVPRRGEPLLRRHAADRCGQGRGAGLHHRAASSTTTMPTLQLELFETCVVAGRRGHHPRQRGC